MKKLSRLYLILVFICLYLPIVYLVVYSFSQGTTMTHYHGFTWQHYRDLLADPRLLAIVADTLLIALLSALLATFIGTLGALSIHQTSKKVTRTVLLNLNNILMVSPDVIIGASFLIFFTTLQVPLGFWSVLLSHVAFEIPIVVLMEIGRAHV